MNRLYLSFALLCCFALSGSVHGNPAIAAAEGIAIAKEGIDTLNQGLDLYDKVLDKVVPWSKLQETIDKLDQYRSDYSKQAAELVGDIKTKMLDGMDAYNRAVQSVFEWCGLATNLLDTYKNLLSGKMNQGNFDSARKILLEVLNDGINKMTAGQQALDDSSSSFNVAAGELTKLNHQLKADFDQNSEYYKSQKSHIRAVAFGSAAPFLILGLSIAAGVVEGKLIPELNDKMASIEKWYKQVTVDVQSSLKNIDDTKAKLQEEIKRIGDVKVQTETTKTYVGLDDNADLKGTILKSVENLITKCKDYQKRHNGGK